MVDMVFRPTTARLATVMAEMQRRDDPQCERKFLRKVLAERSRGSAAARIAPYMLYAEERVRARALTADIPADGPPAAVTFGVRRVILTQVDPRRLERLGGEALIVLPIVGSAANALDQADRWLNLVRREATLGDDGLGMFLRLMADRFSDRSLPELFPKGWQRVKETAMARELRLEGVREGERKGERKGQLATLSNQLRILLGPQPALEEALSRAGPATLEEVGGVLVGKLSDARKLSRLEELLVPGRNGRSASRPRRARSSRGRG